MKKIGLVVKTDQRAIDKAADFEKWLIKKDIKVIRQETIEPEKSFFKKRVFPPSDLFCVFVLGGDGTFLRAARWIGNQNIPVIGVKFGQVGFLAELSEDNLFSAADDIINEKFRTRPRMRLRVKVIRNNLEYFSEIGLNDIVINKGALARLADIKTYIDDYYLTTYRADGLIISTPTGSTAYSLAAGGPVIHPAVPSILITPICPFTLTNRPLIVPDSVSIRIETSKKASDMMLTIDGQEGLEIKTDDIIIIEKWPYPINMIKIPNQIYYDVLKAKLRWSGSRV